MDKFSGVKSVIPGDILTALRVQPQLHGIVAQNSSSFGDIGGLEAGPLRAHKTAINEWQHVDVMTH